MGVMRLLAERVGSPEMKAKYQALLAKHQIENEEQEVMSTSNSAISSRRVVVPSGVTVGA